jgi:hypothetical protein
MADQAFFEGRQSTPIPVAHQVTPVSALALMAARMECNPVGSVYVTPIVQDQSIGDYVREIRIFSAPAGGAEPELLLAVRLHGLTAKQLEIATPAHVI